MATLPLALAGVAAEFGVIMLDYQKQAWAARVAAGRDGEDDLLAAIREGAVLRVRPKAMTVATIVAGLLPLFWGAVQAVRSCSASRLR